MMRTTMLKRAATALTLLGMTALPLVAQADEPWLVRVRAVNLDSANKDSTGLGLSINDKVIPEVDISYFFTPQLAAELVLTYPQKHKVRSYGVEIGSLKHLPPTLMLQYHFTNASAFKPYLGAGVNYTRFSSVHFHPAVAAVLQPSVDKNSFGLAAQAGFDYQINKNLLLNVDLKKVQIRTDVKSFGRKAGEFRVDPWLLGVGLGWRF
ncbi:OmpW/AlkL family protein [Chitinimonas lacunae]|uniref:OmpW family protein n=1 Tax=Chitinimonas lacunae TaxID=1963018 RepID=A0ABV8MMM6_9NEIS